jgi:hypothetical protein
MKPIHVLILFGILAVVVDILISSAPPANLSNIVAMFTGLGILIMGLPLLFNYMKISSN